MTELRSKQPIFSGAQCNMHALIRRHLFLLCPNNSGSTFLSKAIATSPNIWSLAREGQHALGYKGFVTNKQNALIWAAKKSLLEQAIHPSEFDWARNKKTWYFQARSTSKYASVFFTNTPSFLTYPEMLSRHFENSRFIIMVRNPYAVVEAILRYENHASDADALLLAACAHVIACLQMQRLNQDRYRQNSVFFTYEDMCDNPKETTRKIMNLAPEIKTLALDQRLFIKGQYFEHLRNMNDEQIARLTPDRLRKINKELAPHRALLAHFGYDVINCH